MRIRNLGRHRHLPPLAALLVGCTTLYGYRASVFVIDDAWISFRVARNLLEHGALTYDVTGPPVEGMTNLLWVLLSTTWIGLGLEPMGIARLVGALYFLVTIVVVFATVKHAAHGHGVAGTWPALAGALFVAGNSTLAFYAMSGLETSLWYLLYVGVVACAARTLSDGSTRWSLATGVLLGLLVWARPEGGLVGLVVVGFFLARVRGQRGTVLPTMGSADVPSVLRASGHLRREGGRVGVANWREPMEPDRNQTADAAWRRPGNSRRLH